MIDISKIIRILDLTDAELHSALDYQYALKKEQIETIDDNKSEIEAFLFCLAQQVNPAKLQTWIFQVTQLLEQEKLALEQLKQKKIALEQEEEKIIMISIEQVFHNLFFEIEENKWNQIKNWFHKNKITTIKSCDLENLLNGFGINHKLLSQIIRDNIHGSRIIPAPDINFWMN